MQQVQYSRDSAVDRMQQHCRNKIPKYSCTNALTKAEIVQKSGRRCASNVPVAFVVHQSSDVGRRVDLLCAAPRLAAEASGEKAENRDKNLCMTQEMITNINRTCRESHTKQNQHRYFGGPIM